MNCKNCEYAIKHRNLQDNEWYTRCTYEEGECVKIADLEDKLANADYQLEGRDNEIRELKAQIEKMKLCQICKHYQWKSCNYHSLNEKACKANNHSLFELVGDERK